MSFDRYPPHVLDRVAREVKSSRPDVREQRGLLLALALAGSLVVVAATHGLRLLAPAVLLGPVQVREIRIIGAIAVIAGVVVLLFYRKRAGADLHRGSEPTLAALGAAAITMGTLTLIALLAAPPTPGSGGRQRTAAPTRAGSRAVVAVPGSVREGGGFPMIGGSASGGGGGEAGRNAGNEARLHVIPRAPRLQGGLLGSLLDRLDRILLPIILLAMVVIALVLLRRMVGRRGRGPPALDEALGPSEAAASLQASLAEVAPGGQDPRQQITAAYLRLLMVLAASGASRRPQEAPHEYLRRVLGQLGVSTESLHRLAELYVFAQFAERPVTERHKLAAVDALEAGLASLRAANAWRGEGREDPAPSEGQP